MALSPHDRSPAAAPAEPPATPPPAVATAASRRRAPLPVAAAVAALWAATVSCGAVVCLAVLVGAGPGLGGTARRAVAIWLLGHGVPVDAPTDRITLVPLAISALAAWRLVRAGIHASRAVGGHRTRSTYRAVAAGAAVALGYAGLGAAGAVLANGAELSVSPLRAAATMGVFGGLAATGGAVAHSRAGRALLEHVARILRDAVRAGVAAAALTVAAGAGAAGVALAIRGGDAADVLGSYRAGVLGQAGITLLCLAYLPNLAVWGAAYLLGPGFSVGTDTVVSSGDVLLGPVPGLPVLAGLPSAPLSGVGPALLALPLVAGVCAGWLLARRRHEGTAWADLAGAALAGPICGVVLQAAAIASGGALGSGRLAQVGPSAWWIGLVAAGVVSVGAMVGAAITRMLTGSPAKVT